MEEVLYLYHLPYDPLYPLICIDERPWKLIDDILQPLPMKDGMPKRENYHYKCNDVVNLFIAFEPKTRQRIVQVTKRRTKGDYARFLLKVANHYPQAETIRVVQDNLNTHNPSSFYQAFDAIKAFQLTQK